jgi:hypothetical protein
MECEYFRCRHCYDLVYESQRENGPTRLISKAQKIRQRLGGSASLMEPFPPKPKGMHWQTYERLWWHAQEAEVTGMTAALAQFERLHARSHIDGHHNTSQNLTHGNVQTSVG